MIENQNGKTIQACRLNMCMTLRKFASFIGTSTRRMRAIENGTDPKPRKENRVYRVDERGIRTYKDMPVRDILFDLNQQQARVLKFLASL